MIVNTNLTTWDLLQAIIPVANRQSLDMARRCKELRNIHQIKSTIHCLGINLTNIRVLWDHIWLNWYRFLTSVVRKMWSDRGDSVFYSLIGRSILMNWAFAQQLGVLIPQRVVIISNLDIRKNNLGSQTFLSPNLLSLWVVQVNLDLYFIWKSPSTTKDITYWVSQFQNLSFIHTDWFWISCFKFIKIFQLMARYFHVRVLIHNKLITASIAIKLQYNIIKG